MQFYSFQNSSGAKTFGYGIAPEGAEILTEAEHDQQIALVAQPAIVPDRCSKLGLKRALSETGDGAVFSKPEWPAVKAAIAADPDMQEDWDLATEIVRGDRLVQAMVALRRYDNLTVDKILVRASALVG